MGIKQERSFKLCSFIKGLLHELPFKILNMTLENAKIIVHPLLIGHLNCIFKFSGSSWRPAYVGFIVIKMPNSGFMSGAAAKIAFIE